ncbi:serine protease [Labrys sp. KNU-23]|uniref:serine protease n=1 Tax=Labrys sp. KNU-23 TaxID=2789216 RepID=UPI001FEDC76C|nr:serine protease [Labrys sp. KNU-23]
MLQMWRVLLGWLMLLAFAGGAWADVRPPGYSDAAQAFAALSLDQRVRLQTSLNAAGFWPAVPNSVFGLRLYTAITQFQSSNGLPPTGIVTPDQQQRLDSIANPLFGQWGFRSIAHPDVGVHLWVPMGLGLVAQRTPDGLRYEDPRGRVVLDYGYFPSTSLESSLSAWLNVLRSGGDQIGYSVAKRDFFVITAENGNKSSYIRFHRYGAGSLGFMFLFDNTNMELHGDRLETLISASFWSQMTPRAPFIPLPVPYSGALQTTSLPPAPLPPPASSPSTPPQEQASASPSKPADSQPSEFSGTAFFVDATGQLLTNAHVIEKCTSITIAGPNGPLPVRVIARDKANDLALIKADYTPPRVAQFRTGVRLGEAVEAFGYPLSDILSSSGNFTLGNITALTGLGDDTRYFQVSTPVQPGNSGGPLLDASGNLVGVVSAKLNALKTMVANGDIPQNVNFAIKASVAENFLESNGVQYKSGTLSATPMLPADIADQARAESAYVRCH